MENNVQIPQKLKSTNTTISTNPTSVYIPKGNEITVWKSYLYLHVYCSIISNSQDIKTSTHRQMNEKRKYCV